MGMVIRRVVAEIILRLLGLSVRPLLEVVPVGISQRRPRRTFTPGIWNRVSNRMTPCTR